jgi:hypothetical protein
MLINEGGTEEKLRILILNWQRPKPPKPFKSTP